MANCSGHTGIAGGQELDLKFENKAKKLNQIIRRTPLSRPGKIEDVVGLVEFLLKKESGFISGQTILVDGGLSS